MAPLETSSPGSRARSSARTVRISAWSVLTFAFAMLGLFLRWHRLGANSLWFDEGYTAWMVAHPLGQIVHLIRFDAAPPLFYLLLHAWTLATGDSEAGLRSMSALAGSATLAIVWLLARRLLAAPPARAAAVGLCAVSTLLIQQDRDARGYSLAGLLATAALYAVVRWLDSGDDRNVDRGGDRGDDGGVDRGDDRGVDRGGDGGGDRGDDRGHDPGDARLLDRGADFGDFRWLAAAAFCLIGVIYTNNVMMLYTASLAVAAVVLPGDLPLRPRLRGIALAALVIALAYLPWVPALRAQMQFIGHAFWAPGPSWTLAGEIVAGLGGVCAGWRISDLARQFPINFHFDPGYVASSTAIILAIGLALDAMLQRRRSRSRGAAFGLAIYAIGPILLATLMSLHGSSLLLAKAFVASNVVFPILLASAIDRPPAGAADGAANDVMADAANDAMDGLTDETRETPAGRGAKYAPAAKRLGAAAPVVRFAALATLLLLASVSAVALVIAPSREDWRGAARCVADLHPADPSRRLIVFVANDGQLPFDYYYDRFVPDPAARSPETGAPVGFLENDPPRALMRVENTGSLSRVQNRLSPQNVDEVLMVLSHCSWSDPDGLTTAMLRRAGWSPTDVRQFREIQIIRWTRR